MDDQLQQGITAYKVGKRDEARNIFMAVVKQNPDSETAWGWMYMTSNNDKEKIHCLKQILRINPESKRANQLYKKINTPKSTPIKSIILVSTMLVCLLGVCSLGFLFAKNLINTSPPTIQAQIPIETLIGLTSSAALNQTAMSSSSTPLPVATFVISDNIPTATVFIFQLQTNVAQPTEYIYSTNTPFSLATQLLPTQQSTVPPQSAVCSCSGNTLNCGDFSTHSQAQACYDYCVSLGRGDVHDIDGNDKDGNACESLP